MIEVEFSKALIWLILSVIPRSNFLALPDTLHEKDPELQ